MTEETFELDPKKIKESYRAWRSKSYKIIKGYKIDRLIIKTGLLIILVGMFFFAYSNNFELDYFSCQNQVEMCRNPFYRPMTWKNLEYLSPGEYGVEPNWPGKLNFFILSTLALAFSINHLVHNRRYKFNEHRNNRKNIKW